ncbi:hypothetical protein SAMN05216357_12171 [Porphyromonadaceae bacterium KH3CP3RA]|nr:hypothetical protein SAMN05216357_12171 [Porphyromonadaceae bacterium KH3CP3RA]
METFAQFPLLLFFLLIVTGYIIGKTNENPYYQQIFNCIILHNFIIVEKLELRNWNSEIRT